MKNHKQSQIILYLTVSIACFLIIQPFTPTQAQFCFKPKPLPTCKTFPITEIGIHYRLTPSPLISHDYKPSKRQQRTFYVTIDLGIMRNISKRYALGATHLLGVDSELKFRSGLKPRLRRWLGKKMSIDLSPGIILWDTRDDFTTPGFTGSIDLNIKEWFALSVMFEYMRSRQEEHSTYYRGSENDAGLYFGMKTGSYSGLIANSAAVVIGLIGLIGWFFIIGD
jgi:hypothetical protein